MATTVAMMKRAAMVGARAGEVAMEAVEKD